MGTNLTDFGIKVFTFGFIFMLSYFLGQGLDFPKEWLAGISLYVAYISILIMAVRSDCQKFKDEIMKEIRRNCG